MSVKIMGMVWDMDLSPEHKFILLALTDHADHDGGNMYPSIDTLVNKTGYSRSTVNRAIKWFKDEGYLVNTGEKRIWKNPQGRWTWIYQTGPMFQGVSVRHTQGVSETGAGCVTAVTHKPSYKPSINDEDYKGSNNFSNIDVPVPDNPSPNTPLYNLYNQVQLITPLLADRIDDAVEDYCYEWVKDAITRAIEGNAHNWFYVEKVLKNMKKNGPAWKPTEDKQEEQPPKVEIAERIFQDETSRVRW